MNRRWKENGGSFWGVMFALLLAGTAGTSSALAQDNGDNGKKQENRPRLELYGYVMTDIVHDFERLDPLWFDVLRPTKLPAFPGEFGENDHQWFSVRQTRVGTKVHWPTDLGEIFGIFEWELFGVGVDQGQTTFRLRHAYAELGKFGMGQYWSVFMDPNVFPNSIEYWGPNGMVFFRNIQFRYMHIKGESNVVVALERPGASGDRGDFAERIELENVVGRFPWPDFTIHGRLARKWGYVQLGAVFRAIKWDDLLTEDEFDLEGDDLGWGVALSSQLKVGKRNVFKLQGVVGAGSQNYMNDAPVDVGIVLQPLSIRRPIIGEALPFWSMMAFYDHYWSEKFSSSIGYSRLDMDNSNGQGVLSFQNGQYALVNLLYYPTVNLMVGGEVQWGRRKNFDDAIDFDDEFDPDFEDFHSNDWRLQFSGRFNFSFQFWKDLAANDK